MIETIRIDYRDMNLTPDKIMQQVENACFRLLLRMWAAELHGCDGWCVQRIETRAVGFDSLDIINLRPYNVRSRKYYQERQNG